MASKLGYLLSGPFQSGQTQNAVTNMLHVAAQHDDDKYALHQFWHLETTETEVESNVDKKFLQQRQQFQQ